MVELGPVFLVAVAGAFAAAWLTYFRWKDHAHPEPRVLVVVVAIGGAVAIVPALFGYEAFERAGTTPSWELMRAGDLLDAIVAAAAIGTAEECAKLLPVMWLALRSRHFDELIDGLLYAAAAGIGFSCAETLVLALSNELSGVAAVARAITAPLTHAMFACVWGAGLAVAVLRRRWWLLAVALAASIVLHAGYDLALARTGVAASGALVILGIWIWLMWIARRWAKLDPIPRVPAAP